MHDIFLVKKLLITEKATDLNTQGQYVFAVKSSANKAEIKKYVKAVYHVDAVSVNTLNRHGKPKQFRGVAREKSGYKRAIVTLKEGQKIDVAK